MAPFQHKFELHRAIMKAFGGVVRFDASHPPHLPSYRFTIQDWTFVLDTSGNISQAGTENSSVANLIARLIEECRFGPAENCEQARLAIQLFSQL